MPVMVFKGVITGLDPRVKEGKNPAAIPLSKTLPLKPVGFPSIIP